MNLRSLLENWIVQCLTALFSFVIGICWVKRGFFKDFFLACFRTRAIRVGPVPKNLLQLAQEELNKMERTNQKTKAEAEAEAQRIFDTFTQVVECVREIENRYPRLYARGRCTSNLERKGRRPSDPAYEDIKKIMERKLAKSACGKWNENVTYQFDKELEVKVKGAPYKWVLDPLDGERHFIREMPIFVTSIALLKRGEKGIYSPILAVIYSPSTKEFFFAIKGCGAYLNNWKTRLKVSKRKWMESFIGILFPNCECAIKGKGLFNRKCLIVNEIFEKAHRVRSLGVGSLSMAYVAKGALDAYIALSSTSRKMLNYSGILIVQEAKGEVKMFPFPDPNDGSTEDSGDEECVLLVASNKELFEDLKGLSSKVHRSTNPV